MYAPMAATHIQTFSRHALKSKNGTVSIIAKSTTSGALQGDQDFAKAPTKSKFLHHLSNGYNKTKSILSGKKKSSENDEHVHEHRDACGKSNILLKRKADGSYESTLTTPDVEQLLAECTMTGSIISSEAGNNESSKTGTTIQASSTTPVQNHVESSGVDRIDWALGALPLREPTPANPERVMSETSSIADSKTSLHTEDGQGSESFLVRTINKLITDHPVFSEKLSLLKTAIEEQEEDIEAMKVLVQGGMTAEGLDAKVQAQKMEKRVNELLAEANLRNNVLQGLLEAVVAQADSAADHIKTTEKESLKKELNFIAERSILTRRLNRFQRRMANLLVSLQAMESHLDWIIERKNLHKEGRLEAEKVIKALEKKNEELEKNVESLEKRVSSYLEYTDKLEVLNEDLNKRVGVSATKRVITIPPPGGKLTEWESSPEVMKKATNTLREEYVNANITGQPVESLRGSEFLAWKEEAFKKIIAGDVTKVDDKDKGKRVLKDWRKEQRRETFITGHPSDDAFAGPSTSVTRSSAPALHLPVSFNSSVRRDQPVSTNHPASLSDFPAPPSRSS